jgi:DNA polymerase-3 subunit epsilon
MQRRATRAALPAPIRSRLAQLRRETRLARRLQLRGVPIAADRYVVVDLETTGPRMDRDRIIAIGAVAVARLTLRHDDAFTAVLRQPAPSSVGNILVHRIGGQEQVGGVEPVAALVDFLEYRSAAVAVAFRADFDATVLARELELQLGVRVPRRFVDLAVLLPALFPGTQNDSLEDWLAHFDLLSIGRHDALADAYATAQLLLIVLAAAQQSGARTTGDLLALERAQRWLGRRR